MLRNLDQVPFNYGMIRMKKDDDEYPSKILKQVTEMRELGLTVIKWGV